MIEYKSPREIAIMKEAGAIVALCHQFLADFIQPGRTLLEIDEAVKKIILEHNAIPSFKDYEGYPKNTCISVNEVVVHGIPNQTQLKNGDIVTVDIGAFYKGFHGDSGWTYAVGEISDEKKHLMKITEESLWIALDMVKPNVSLNQISKAIEQHVESNGLAIVKELAGHGIGRNLHEEPTVLNYDAGLKDVILKEGLVIAIEPIVACGKGKIKLLNDGWTVMTEDKKPAAHYEHTIAVTKNGSEILTNL